MQCCCSSPAGAALVLAFAETPSRHRDGRGGLAEPRGATAATATGGTKSRKTKASSGRPRGGLPGRWPDKVKRESKRRPRSRRGLLRQPTKEITKTQAPRPLLYADEGEGGLAYASSGVRLRPSERRAGREARGS